MPADESWSSDVIHVAFAADAGFVKPLAVAVTSLALTHAPGEVAVTILHDGLREADMERIERSVDGRVALTWRRVSRDDVAGVHHSVFLTPASLFRLLLPRLLPATVERVIYLDCDVVVESSLRPLWNLDLQGMPVAAVRDAGSPFAAGPLGTDWRDLRLNPDSPYLNTGVLVLALDTWRRAELSERALEVLRTSTPRWGDQDGINAILQGKWFELPRRWNLQTADAVGTGIAWALWNEDVRDANADPAIVHYTERDKPWHPGSAHPHAARWFGVLDHTEWAGWRPSSAPRPAYRRAASRLKRAWHTLTADQAPVHS